MVLPRVKKTTGRMIAEMIEIKVFSSIAAAIDEAELIQARVMFLMSCMASQEFRN